jgi:hypothetical protein
MIRTVTGVAVGTSVITVSSPSPALSTTYTVTVGSAKDSESYPYNRCERQHNAGDKDHNYGYSNPGDGGKAVGDNTALRHLALLVERALQLQVLSSSCYVGDRKWH